MRVFFTLLLVTFFTGLLPAAVEAQPKCSTRPTISLPLYPSEKGKFEVPVTVDGRELRLEPDTGAKDNILASSVSDTLKLERAQNTGKKDSMFGGAPLKQYVTAKDVRMGGQNIGGQKMFILPDARVQGADGTIASDFLIHFDIELDYVAGRLNLFTPCTGRAAYWPHKDIPAILPFKTNAYNYIRLPVRLDGKSVWARIDTGASASVFDINAMRETFGYTTTSPELAHIGGAHDNTGWYRHTFDRLELGTITLPKAEVDFIPDSARGHGFAELFIGSDILRNYHVYISYAERTVTLTKPTGETKRIAASNAFTQAFLAAYHGKVVEAIPLYSQAINSDYLAPSYRAAAYYERALLYAFLRQCPLAASDFATAQKIDPYLAVIARGQVESYARLHFAKMKCPGLTAIPKQNQTH